VEDEDVSLLAGGVEAGQERALGQELLDTLARVDVHGILKYTNTHGVKLQA
jgi:hypothetical protein